MPELTAWFVAALAARALVRIGLAARQIGAVRAHRDRVPDAFRDRVGVADHARAADYAVARARTGMVAASLDAAIAWLLTIGGGIAAADAAFRPAGWGEPWRSAAVVLAVALLVQAAELPLSVYRTFGLEARFGFNRVTPALFVADLARELLLGLAIGVPLVAATLALMQSAGAYWWLWVWCIWGVAMLVLTWAAPRFLAPLFNRFTPLADEALARRVDALVARCGFSARGGVFVMDGSRRSRRSNAYFTGIGRNKRIVFFDTMLEELEPAEIEAVLAHELGHFKLHHVRDRLIVSAAASCGGLALLAWLARRPEFYAALGVPIPSPAAALLLFFYALPVFAFFATPVSAWWSRRQEWQADAFAAEHASASRLASALVKLYRDNASTLTPDRWHSLFYDSHPPASERVGRLLRRAGGEAPPAG